MDTLEQVRDSASQLPPDQQEMLAEILHRRQNEEWRQRTARDAREWISAFREGKLKSESSKEVIESLRAGLDSSD